MELRKAAYLSVIIRVGALLFCVSLLVFRNLRSAPDQDKKHALDEKKMSLLRAVKFNDTKTIKNLIEDQEVPLDGVMSDGGGLLHVALQDCTSADRFATFVYLVGKGASVKQRNHDGQTPLHRTVEVEDLNLRMRAIRELVMWGGDINEGDGLGRTLLDHHVLKRDKEAVARLISEWGPLMKAETIARAKKVAGKTAGEGLGYTDMYNVLEATKPVMVAGSDGLVGKTGMSALMIAVIKKDVAGVQELLQDNAHTKETMEQWSLMHTAVLGGFVAVVSMLVGERMRLDVRNKMGDTPLLVLSRSMDLDIDKKKEMITLLIGAGADDKVKGADGSSLLMAALRSNNCDLVRWLQAKGWGGNVQHKDNKGASAQQIAGARLMSDCIQ